MHTREFWTVKVDGVFQVNKGVCARGRYVEGGAGQTRQTRLKRIVSARCSSRSQVKQGDAGGCIG